MSTTKLNPNRLIKDELVYELMIRGVSSSGNVEDDRRLLREAYHLGYAIKNIHLEPQVELMLCKNKLEELLSRILTFKVANRTNDFDSIYTRLQHVLGRLRRLEVEPVLQGKYEELHRTCLELMSRLRDVYEGSEETEQAEILLDDADKGGQPAGTSSPKVIEDLQKRVDEKIADLSTSSIRERLEDLTFEPRVSLPPVAPVLPDALRQSELIGKLGLKFDGESTSLSAFIQRAEELCEARNILKEQLFKSAADILSGDALNFWRANKRRYRNWEDLVTGLKMAFQPYNYATRLWTEIRERTQHPSESVVSYISVMEELFARLPEIPSESTRLEIIRPNLLPYLQFELALKPVTTIEELMIYGRNLEEGRAVAARYKLPPPVSSQSLEPDLAFKKNRIRQQVSWYTGLPTTGVTNASTRVSPVVTQQTSNTLASKQFSEKRDATQMKIRCWNCDQVGHRAPSCTAPETLYCHKCGKKGVSMWRCPTCSNKNKAKPQQSGNFRANST
ncbi:hypothetical protein Zmor_020722 [Zophobas morio]|uniref:CCHC-type domain-containing protein n=1 Tax=Zophobas morio TaxID=2755281 RepID=A0AA38I747_9CUCU|nr:hypothetical protein Zmor_020722 [Zophobas morio]